VSAGQSNGELSELADPAIDVDRSAMLLGHDVIAYREAKAGAFTGWLGREERLKELVLDLGRVPTPLSRTCTSTASPRSRVDTLRVGLKLESLPSFWRLSTKRSTRERPGKMILGISAFELVEFWYTTIPTPSKADITVGKDIVKVRQPLAVTFHAHLITGRGRHTSLARM
jgi:hypothetical protein